MEDAFRQAFVQQARKRLRIDRQVLARLGGEPGSIAHALVRDGYTDLAGVRSVFEGVRERLLSRNVQHHRDAADRALLRMAVRASIVSGDAAAVALQRWNERPVCSRTRLSDELVETGAITGEQRALLARRLDGEQVACAICGYHLDRLAVEPGMCCPRCGWPELVTPRDADGGAATTWTGRTVGGWTLVERIGQGGTGRVFYARHPTHGEGAFKVLNPQAASEPRWLARFEREARAAGGIDHPGVVRILDVGQDEELPYLVMEWVDGESLARRLDRAGPLEIQHAVQVSRRLAGALAAAHATGVIHRDIKPANVLLDREQRAKLADFGLARGVVDNSVSQVGAVIGSPGYMSPEQVKGEPLDFRSDVFTLGLLIHAMVTGRSPLARGGAMDSMRATVNERVPPLSRAVPTVPPLLDALVLEMTAREPARRTESMARVLESLERIPAGAGGGTEPFPDAGRRARAPASLGYALAAALPARGAAIRSGPANPPADPGPSGPVPPSELAPSELALSVRALSVRALLNGPLGFLLLLALAILTGLMLRTIWPQGQPARAPESKAGGAGSTITTPEVRTPNDPAVSGDPVRGPRTAHEVVAAHWEVLIDAPGTPTQARHTRWCQVEAAADPALAVLMAQRRAQAMVELERQATAEVAEIGAAIDAALARGHWDQARLQADLLPTWTSPLAAAKARRIAAIDDRRYGSALAQVVELVKKEPDRAGAAIGLLARHPVLAKRHTAWVAAEPRARWVNDLAVVVAACEAHVDAFAVPCVLRLETVDGATVELELEAVEPTGAESGEVAWGRELRGVVGGKPAVLRWPDLARAQKASWAIAGLFREPVSAAEQRRLVGAYLVAGGVDSARIATVLGQIDR